MSRGTVGRLGLERFETEWRGCAFHTDRGEILYAIDVTAELRILRGMVHAASELASISRYDDKWDEHVVELDAPLDAYEALTGVHLGYRDRPSADALRQESVAIYAGIVAMGEWAAQCARSVRVKCPTCRCMRRVWPPPGPCMCCAGQFDLEPEDYP